MTRGHLAGCRAWGEGMARLCLVGIESTSGRQGNEDGIDGSHGESAKQKEKKNDFRGMYVIYP